MSKIDFYHSPNTRSTGVKILLDELGVDYQLHLLSLKRGDHKRKQFLAINPLGKVPAIAIDGHVLTESVAIFIYLADRFNEAKLAPALDAPERADYLRWLVLYGSCFEPAVIDRHLGHDPAPGGMSPYGSYAPMFDALVAQLERTPYLTGEQCLAVDIYWGVALGWLTQFKLVDAHPAIMAFVKRIAERPCCKKAWVQEALLQQRLDQQA